MSATGSFLLATLRLARQMLATKTKPLTWPNMQTWIQAYRPHFLQWNAAQLKAFDKATRRPRLWADPSEYPNQRFTFEDIERARSENDRLCEAVRVRTLAFLDEAIACASTDGATTDAPKKREVRILLCHGHSHLWKDLRHFLTYDLKLDYDEYNAESAAGVGHEERIREMLDRCDMAFLVMTAEDRTADGEVRARQNVVHELGRCQELYGSRRAIVLQEEGCTLPSNYDGRNTIRFPRGNLDASREELRRVLAREGMIR